MINMKKEMLFFYFFLFFLIGCTQNFIESEAKKFGMNVINGSIFEALNVSINKSLMDTMLNNSSCTFFICINKTAKRFFIFTDTSLVNANCSFVSINISNFSLYSEFLENLSKDKNIKIRPFGFGHGPTLSDFNEANAYCNYSYSYSIRFIIGNNSGYVKPISLKPSVLCVLEANVIPIFVFYNKDASRDIYGEPPLNDNSHEIAQILNGTGPVIVATEINPKKDDRSLRKIINQIRSIKSNCINCKVFLSISIDEIYDDSRFYLNKTKINNYLNEFDGFAFGIDSRFSRAKPCGGDSIMLKEVVPLIKFINNEFNKPTIIYYIYLPDTDKCSYGDNDYFNIYDQLSLLIPELVLDGLIAFSPQPFFPSEIFYCKECSLTTYNETKKEFEDAKYRFQAWFDLCSKYYTGGSNLTGGNDYKKGYILPAVKRDKNSLPICTSLVPSKEWNLNIPRPSENFTKVLNITSKGEAFYKCSFCIDFSEPTEVLTSLSINLPFSACDKTKILFTEADKKENDGVVARVIGYYKSKGDKCFIEYNNTDGIFVDEETEKILKDASKEENCREFTNKYGENCNRIQKLNESEQPCKIKSLGIYSFSYMPGKYYKSNMPKEVEKCGKEFFNPFNINDSSCIFDILFDEAYQAADLKMNKITFPSSEQEKRQVTALLTTMYIVNKNAFELVDIYEDLVKSNYNCNIMTIAKNFCCELHSETRKKNGETETITYYTLSSTCNARNFGVFLKNVANDEKHKEKYKEAILAAQHYAKFYDICEDCYSSKWKSNVCKVAKRFGLSPEQLREMGCQ